MVRTQLIGIVEIKRTLNENVAWRGLPAEQFVRCLKVLLETKDYLTEEAKEYVRERLRLFEEAQKQITVKGRI